MLARLPPPREVPVPTRTPTARALAALPRPLALAASSALLVAAACGGGSDNLPPPPPPPPPPPESVAPVATTPPAEAPPAKPAAPPVTLTLGAASPDPAAPLPTVKITAPAKDQVVPEAKAADFAVKLDVKNWATATGSSHVHLILDNKPYKPIYDTKAPVKLSELSGGEALAEGQHVLVAFPSRANHESVKTKDAFVAVSFWVGKKGKETVDLKKPMLVYSRPKGDYKAEAANHVLVDFYVANTKLAEPGPSVGIKVTGPGISGELAAKATAFGAPFYLDGLQNGSYDVALELKDDKGEPVPGPWNTVKRTIKIDHDAPADPQPHGDHGAPAAADAGAPAKGDAGAAKAAAPAAAAKPGDAGAPKK